MDKCAGKINVLTRGDLPLDRKIGDPDREVRLEWQGSAEAIVPSKREGLNNEEGRNSQVERLANRRNR